MKADAAPILAIFEKKVRLEVPLFQRQYVWTQDDQWEPLWEDISRKFEEVITGRKDGPVHFLGAMVLDQKQTPTTHVERRQIIDGQQRLTTFQIFLASFRDFCSSENCGDLATECDAYIFNKGMMADPDLDRFKVWPTQLDRGQFTDVLTARSREALELLHPLKTKRYARRPEPRPRMVEAYIFFLEQLSLFFNGNQSETPVAVEQSLAGRLEESFNALRRALQVVVIDLDESDDAQVIFETLNARGAPLLPADLLRNFIFLRAARQGADQESLYARYWSGFDDDFWRGNVRQGRLTRSRSDLFLQYFLTSRQIIEIPMAHLFAEYKYWIQKKAPFPTIQDELSELSRQGSDFRRLFEPKPGDPLFQVASMLMAFDTGTAYPLLLFLLKSRIDPNDLVEISVILESYIVRRAVCDLTIKAYNRIFLGLIRTLRDQGATPSVLRGALSAMVGDSSVWPRDDQFRDAWHSQRAYASGQNPRIVYIMKRLNDTYMKTKSEDVQILSSLTVEHLMPQNWIAHWPLEDGSMGLSEAELLDITEDTAQSSASRKRHLLVQTLGNLTILPQPLNSTLSNAAWGDKKPELLFTLLPLNQQLQDFDRWDAEAITVRSNSLFDRALRIWPSP